MSLLFYRNNYIKYESCHRNNKITETFLSLIPPSSQINNNSSRKGFLFHSLFWLLVKHKNEKQNLNWMNMENKKEWIVVAFKFSHTVVVVFNGNFTESNMK